MNCELNYHHFLYFLNLSILKVHLQPDISYDNSNDQVVGPHSAANVLNIRGVFTKYLIPVYYSHDGVMEPEELNDIIDKIQSCGYDVCGITADNHTTNVSLAKKLGCTDDDPKFPNPSVGREGDFIYFLFDPVHLIKCLRNHLIDQGTVWHFSNVYIISSLFFSYLLRKQKF